MDLFDSEEFDFSSDIERARSQLADQRANEHKLEQQVTSVLSEHVDVPRHLARSLHRLSTRLTLVESDVSQLRSNLAHTSVLAERISGRVRELDESKTRVVDCLQRVEDLLDLRLCTEGVQSAMSQEDYEQAASHVHRFLTLDQDLFQMGELAQDEKEDDSSTESVGSLRHSYSVLKQAQATLTKTIESKFDEAVQEKDTASIERFFKLFPMLGEHKLGINKFTAHLRTLIAHTAHGNYEIMKTGGQDPNRKSVLFADTLTLLFEGIARVIEIHQPLIDKHYGHEHMADFILALQCACDNETDRIVDEFVLVRQYERKARLINSSSSARQNISTVEKSDTDPLELDVLLSEVTLMQTRAEMYLRFLRRRVTAPHKQQQQEDTSTQPQLSESQCKVLTALRQSRMATRLQELMGAYIAMEQYYMERSIRKIVATQPAQSGIEQSETVESAQSTTVDDVFFVARRCIRRALSSGNVHCVCAVINNAATLLDTDYCTMVKSQLKNGYPSIGSLAEAYTSAAAAYSSIQQGKMPTTGGFEGAERVRYQFIAALNNAQTSHSYLRALQDTVKQDVAKYFPKHLCSEADLSKIELCVSQLDEVAVNMSGIRRLGVQQLVLGAAKPRLKTAAHAFQEYTHAPTEDEFADFEVNDPFIEQFITVLDSLLVAFQPQISDECYLEFCEQVASEAARQLEKTVMICTFNRLGGLQFDKEVRELSNYLTGSCGWTVRERLARVTHMAALLNVESAQEAQELCQQQMSYAALSSAEMHKVLALRVDLPAIPR